MSNSTWEQICNSPLMAKVDFDKNKGTFKSINGKEIKYQMSNGSQTREQLAATIFAMNTIPEYQLKNWNSEHHIQNETKDGYNRADFVAEGSNGKVLAIWESKEESKISNEDTFKKVVKGSFNQVKDKYVSSLITGGKINSEVFVTTAVFDLDKMIDNPNNINLYSMCSFKEKNDEYECFRKYGIFIRTEKASINYSDTDAPVNLIAYQNELNNKHQLPQFSSFSIEPKPKGNGEKAQFLKIRDAIHLHTATLTSYGVLNARDIIFAEDKEKVKLTEKIFKSALISYSQRKDHEAWHINDHSQPRAMVFIEEETISVVDDKKNIGENIYNFMNNKSDIYSQEDVVNQLNNMVSKSHQEKANVKMASTNSALVDGQNSLDALRQIIMFLNNDNPHHLINQKLKNIFRKVMGSQNDIFGDEGKKIIDFIENAKIQIESYQADDIFHARIIAGDKNFSNEVKKEDHLLMENREKAISFSKFLYKNWYIHAKFPKNDLKVDLTEFPSFEEKIISIPFVKVAKILKCGGKIIDSAQKKMEPSDILKEADLLSNSSIDEGVFSQFEKNYFQQNKNELTKEESNRLLALEAEEDELNIDIQNQKEDIENAFQRVKEELMRNDDSEKRWRNYNSLLSSYGCEDEMETNVKRLARRKEKLDEAQHELLNVKRDVELILTNSIELMQLNRAALLTGIYQEITEQVDLIQDSIQAKYNDLSDKFMAGKPVKLSNAKVTDFSFGSIVNLLKKDIIKNYGRMRNMSDVQKFIEDYKVREMTTKFVDRFHFVLNYYDAQMTEVRFKTTADEGTKRKSKRIEIEDEENLNLPVKIDKLGDNYIVDQIREVLFEPLEDVFFDSTLDYNDQNDVVDIEDCLENNFKI